MILVTTPGNVRTRSHAAARSRSCSARTPDKIAGLRAGWRRSQP
jgi:hypothetical protein